MKTRTAAITVDGVRVRLLVAPYSVAVAQQLGALGPAPGPSPAFAEARVRAYLDVIGPRFTVAPGDATLDGAPLTAGEEFLQLFAGRLDVLELVRRAVVLAQQPSRPAGIHVEPPTAQDFEIAVRFTSWLSSSDRAPSSPWMKTGADCSRCVAEGFDDARGCDGSPQARIVWHDTHGLILRTCPVRSLTPDVSGVLDLFQLTHALRVTGMGPPQFDRTVLPAAGGLLDQDAWTMDALNLVCLAQNAVISRMYKQHQAAAGD